MIYQLYKNSVGHILIKKIEDNNSGCSFSEDINNTDYQQYLKWLDEGGVPLPAEETQ